MPATYVCSDATKSTLLSLVPGLKDAADDAAMDLLASQIQELSAVDAEDTLDLAGEDTANLSRADVRAKAKAARAAWRDDYGNTLAINETLSQKAATLEAKVQELSAADAPTLDLARTDPKVAGEYSNLYSRKADVLVSEGKMTPVQNRIFKEALKDDGVLMLSREDDQSDRVADLMLSMFGEKVVPVGKVETGVQTLSRETPKDEPAKADDAAPDAAAIAKEVEALRAQHGIPATK